MYTHKDSVTGTIREIMEKKRKNRERKAARSFKQRLKSRLHKNFKISENVIRDSKPGAAHIRRHPEKY